MTTYMLVDGDGNQITNGLGEYEANRVAQRIANERGESVWLESICSTDDVEAVEYTPDGDGTHTLTLGGHSWRWTLLSDERGSLQCLDPDVDDAGIDQTIWPTDAEVSEAVSIGVRFVDAGDAADYPEGIFEVIEGA